ncbi:SDR family oxidoreductase [Geodermatophilus sp. YIM 151500]|uniref:SDR family oxidoreductase n=1 Tax=Geodermatophilus sp. YIM 151500 TaxID=2984531 RepID=UPI0021E40B4C|nr:SDR family oxidoreductase [Geodermatophilus sp. YIM 151500]MCV2489979.1 SDR family oxidoreductase [Geodermatophilus sp. YIM 151500]
MSSRVLVVVGAGPGISGSLARRYARDGCTVGLIGSNEERVRELETELRGSGTDVRSAVLDITDTEATTEALSAMGAAFGHVDVLHFNPSAYREKTPLELTVEELLADVALGVGALLTAVQAVRPYLRSGSRITVTGSVAADEPSHRAASLGVQKAGLRNLVQSLDATVKADGIRAVSVTVRGTLSAEGPFTPDRVAEALHAAARQADDGWRTEIPYDG